MNEQGPSARELLFKAEKLWHMRFTRVIELAKEFGMTEFAFIVEGLRDTTFEQPEKLVRIIARKQQVSPKQRILTFLHANGEASVTEVGEAISLTRSPTNRLLSEMVTNKELKMTRYGRTFYYSIPSQLKAIS